MADDPTLRFYAENAAVYAEHVMTPTGARLNAFLALVPAGGKILELGCGNGRDAAHMLSLGFDVDATDGTPELAAEAERRIGRPVRILRFEHLDANATYDGVWACASLLHAPHPASSTSSAVSIAPCGPVAFSPPASRRAMARVTTASVAISTIPVPSVF